MLGGSINPIKYDKLAERLRRCPAKALGFPRAGSNPAVVVFDQVFLSKVTFHRRSGTTPCKVAAY